MTWIHPLSYVIGFFSAFIWLYVSLALLYRRGHIDIVIVKQKTSLPKLKDSHGF